MTVIHVRPTADGGVALKVGGRDAGEGPAAGGAEGEARTGAFGGSSSEPSPGSSHDRRRARDIVNRLAAGYGGRDAGETPSGGSGGMTPSNFASSPENFSSLTTPSSIPEGNRQASSGSSHDRRRARDIVNRLAAGYR